MAKITELKAREILDSRGNPTVEVDLFLNDGAWGRAAVPAGASTGTYEATELRDHDSDRFLGKGVLTAVKNIRETIAPRIKGVEAGRQQELDHGLQELDGTPNKSHLGANALLAVSLAFAKASAASQELALYQYLARLSGRKGQLLPLPLMNILNGGRHADNALDIQEFMIAPVGAENFAEALRMGTEVFHHLKKILAKKNLSTAVGDEGGFAPRIDSADEVLSLMMMAIQAAGYLPGEQIALALDAAASEFYQDGHYRYHAEGKILSTAEELVDYYGELQKKYPLISIEDGLAEEDWAGWQGLTRSLGKKLQLVGDDLFVTHTARLKKGITEKAGNAILIKVNQIGTLSETLQAIAVAQEAGFGVVISHRSGETEDTTIADLAVGTDSGQIKTGSLSRADRTAKYNQLLRIEEGLGDAAHYAGKAVFAHYS